jgi:hypothetical protein
MTTAALSHSRRFSMEKMVRLKNGSEVLNALVESVCGSLELLGELRPAWCVEFVYFCKDPRSRLSPEAYEYLKKYSFIRSDGEIYPSIRNIVISRFETEGNGRIIRLDPLL